MQNANHTCSLYPANRDDFRQRTACRRQDTIRRRAARRPMGGEIRLCLAPCPARGYAWPAFVTEGDFEYAVLEGKPS